MLREEEQTFWLCWSRVSDGNIGHVGSDGSCSFTTAASGGINLPCNAFVFASARRDTDLRDTTCPKTYINTLALTYSRKVDSVLVLGWLLFEEINEKSSGLRVCCLEWAAPVVHLNLQRVSALG